jgi:hypothetical protein
LSTLLLPICLAAPPDPAMEDQRPTSQADDIVGSVRNRPPSVDAAALEPVVELHGLVEAALVAGGGEGDGVVYGAVVQLARLQARFEDPGHFGAYVQLEAAQGAVQLLDAAARVGDRGGHHLLIGRFKTFLSDDYLVPAGEMIFPTRGLLTGIATTRRVGVQGTARLGRVQVRGGVFNPTTSAPVAGTGVLAMLGLDLPVGHGLHVHTAVSRWIRPDDAVVGDDQQVWHHQADGAVVYHDKGWTVSAEGLVALDGDTLDAGPSWAGGLLGVVARRVPLGGTVEVEPAVSWNSLQADDAVVHLGSAAVNLHKEDWRMVETVALQVEHGPKDDTLASRVVVQVQVAL